MHIHLTFVANFYLLMICNITMSYMQTAFTNVPRRSSPVVLTTSTSTSTPSLASSWQDVTNYWIRGKLIRRSAVSFSLSLTHSLSLPPSLSHTLSLSPSPPSLPPLPSLPSLDELTIHGLGAAIHRAINLALQLQETSSYSLQLSATTSTVELTDDLEPLTDVSW